MMTDISQLTMKMAVISQLTMKMAGISQGLFNCLKGAQKRTDMQILIEYKSK
jgi:hypothetical protein